jgi:hypothetical protein
MRSRTLGPGKVKELAPKLKISEKVLAIHNDQYLPADFDVVITSIGNAFYRTDNITGLFEWLPNPKEIDFLNKFNPKPSDNLKDCAFNNIYLAKSENLAIDKNNNNICTRQKCRNKKDCGFIPNYPSIIFDPTTNEPINTWVPIRESLRFFESFLSD